MELIIGLFIVVTSIIIGIADQDGFRIRTRPYMSKAMLRKKMEEEYNSYRKILRPTHKTEKGFQESWRLYSTYLLKDFEKIYGFKNLDIDKL
ncbi:MAG: hypothetical protein PHQ26_04590 [Bacteroidales bacterium]|nr:hypothetical protein [Bacteroidales bacterium]MDD4770738.1 hypothetical protein [Bacteroidales bacterium]